MKRRFALYFTILCLNGLSCDNERPLDQSDGYIPVDGGVRLFYQKIGDGAEVVIIPASLYLFDDFKAYKPPSQGRTLIFYDMRNRGQSDFVSDSLSLTIQQDVADLERIRQHFKAEKISLIGWSYLGKMVIMYAMVYPNHVQRIIQIGPISPKFGTEYPPHLTANDEHPVVDTAAVNALRKMETEGYHIERPQEHCEKDWQLTRALLVGNPENVKKLKDTGVCDMPNEWWINLERHFKYHFTSVQQTRIEESDIAKVTHPVLTIHGTKDRNAPYGSGREWAFDLPNARLLTIAGAAHLSWVEAPEIIFPAIDLFLNGKWPEAAEKVLTIDKGE